ncbi:MULTISPECIES: hypothetical protein [unclassified Mucilaginibacter]|uniref:hypothetical protein n=1 Tax=unclassified Mucilaginibacter TaxID=2617802 RepID=UPI002AC97A43|nr:MULTISPECIES: hypothetical protein [unclassified Mucilaginibacter]MEB0263636.1 hypothetical protein [Mucilaginibacter sp. 10I4]MEB0280217.1 hypothetical protein [Mucilaginibacter sp. 10B2]MEB0301160.1 hypothetical protein [Mucilaginibacter sp. 5C4]WPX24374.1 hypothetical protein RHM67_03690 [Mucilaginibacter sp. 5C4]
MNTTENFDHILLFKTNVNCDGDKKLLHTLLDGNPDVQCWTVDMDDDDCVLRIVSYTLSHLQIIELMNSRGYSCCELT